MGVAYLVVGFAGGLVGSGIKSRTLGLLSVSCTAELYSQPLGRALMGSVLRRSCVGTHSCCERKSTIARLEKRHNG